MNAEIIFHFQSLLDGSEGEIKVTNEELEEILNYHNSEIEYDEDFGGDIFKIGDNEIVVEKRAGKTILFINE